MSVNYAAPVDSETEPKKFNRARILRWAYIVAAVIALSLVLRVIGCVGSAVSSVLPKEMVEVPNLVGQHYDNVKDSLKDSGFVVKCQNSDGSEAKIVVAGDWRVGDQRPEAGTSVEKGSTIYLLVVDEVAEKKAADAAAAEAAAKAVEEEAKKPVEMPNVVGMMLPEAEAALKDLGMTTTYQKVDGSSPWVFESANWRVDGQSVAAGEQTPRNTNVTLTVTNVNDEKRAAEQAEKEAKEAEREAQEAAAGFATVKPGGEYGGMTESELSDLQYGVVYPQIERYFSSWTPQIIAYEHNVTYWSSDDTFLETGRCKYTNVYGAKFDGRPYSVMYDKAGDILSLEVDGVELITGP